MLIVAKSDRRLLNTPRHFDKDLLGAIDHDVGNIVARQERLQRTIAEHVVANVFEQFFLLGNRHRKILDCNDVIDDIADFLARRVGL